MSDTKPLSAGTSDVVAHMGVWFSNLGVPRAAGQLFGYLLVCDPAEQSASEIAAGIGMSRASVSSSARLLASMNAIEERHRVGDRKTYYRLRSAWWIEVTTAKLNGFTELADMARRSRAAGGLTRTDGLDELIEFSEFWAQEIPRLVERWNRRHDTKEDE
jgi:DNA-binding transcriptional regulator GbsR (MarR family)